MEINMSRTTIRCSYGKNLGQPIEMRKLLQGCEIAVQAVDANECRHTAHSPLRSWTGLENHHRTAIGSTPVRWGCGDGSRYSNLAASGRRIGIPTATAADHSWRGNRSALPD